MTKGKRSKFFYYKLKHNTAIIQNKRETEIDALIEVRLEDLRTHECMFEGIASLATS